MRLGGSFKKGNANLQSFLVNLNITKFANDHIQYQLTSNMSKIPVIFFTLIRKISTLPQSTILLQTLIATFVITYLS